MIEIGDNLARVLIVLTFAILIGTIFWAGMRE